MKENDDKDCSDDGKCNVFAAAYIRPEYDWAIPYNTSDIPFVQNVTSTSTSIITNQINRGRYLNAGESLGFWLVYVQIGYQGSTNVDCDPIEEGSEQQGCSGGVSLREGFLTDAITAAAQVPEGSEGSLIFIETIKDVHRDENRARIKSVPHEIGHQFGIQGDDLQVVKCGLMCYSNGFMFEGLTFSDEHLNIIRWRTKSPGQP